MPKFMPPSHEFIQACYQGGAQKPKAVVLHGTVSSDDKGTARNIARWWQGPTSPKSSAHYVRDALEVIQCVGDHRVAYHCGYNQDSIGYEFCDLLRDYFQQDHEEEATENFAMRWVRRRFRTTTEFHGTRMTVVAILRGAAKDVALLCLAYDIEPKRPTVAELKAKGPHGIYSHNDSRLAFGGTTHTDPRDFPWAQFVRLVRREVKRLKAEGQVTIGLIPKPKPYKLHLTQASMLYSLPLQRKRADLEAIFTRAASRGVDAIGGTEFPDDASRRLLKSVANDFGYRVFHNRGRDDVWLAIGKAFIIGKATTEWDPIGPQEEGFGKPGPRGLLQVHLEDSPIGPVTFAEAHLLTKGRPDGPAFMRQNLELNRRFTRAIGEAAKRNGAGRRLFFYMGDQNIVDRENDTFLGAPLTSSWDELEKWENTGHGNIDVIASYDKDGRVSAAYCRALDDGEFPLRGDHFLVESGFNVKQ